MKKSNIFTFIYLFLWLIPFFVFFKDFFHFSSIIEIFNYNTFYILKNTFIQSSLSVILSFLIAIIPAIYLSQKNNFLAGLLDSSLFIPFFFPPISTVVSFSIIYNLPFMKQLNINYSLCAIIIAHAFYNSPIFVKYIGESLRKIPKGVKESSRMEGCSSFYRFLKIDLPIIFPSVMRGFFLVLIYSFTSFVIVLSLGNIRYSTFETAIVKTLLSSLDFSKAMGFALVQLFFLGLMNYLSNLFSEYDLEEQPVANHKINPLITLSSVCYILFEYLIILIGLSASFYSFFNDKFDFGPLIRIFSSNFNKRFPVLLSIKNSVMIASIVSFFTVIIVYLILRKKSKITNLVVLTSMGFSSAFAAMSLFYLNVLYRIPFLILVIIGHLLLTIPIGYSFMYQHITGFDKSILEAAAIDGANWLNTFRKIEFPLLKSIFISTFLQIFAIVYGEFTIVYTMQMQDYLPLASVTNYRLSTMKLLPESAAFSSLNVVIIFLLFWISKKIEKRK